VVIDVDRRFDADHAALRRQATRTWMRRQQQLTFLGTVEPERIGFQHGSTDHAQPKSRLVVCCGAEYPRMGGGGEPEQRGMKQVR